MLDSKVDGEKAEPGPVVVIRDVAASVTTLSIPLTLMGHIKAGGRATIVQLQTGSLVVFSPVYLTPAVRRKVNALGTVRYIIALNFLHHMFISSWVNEFPEAIVIGMEGLPEKREKSEATKGTKFAKVFTAQNKAAMKISEEFDAELDYEYVHSHKNKELVFLHKPSKTLIQADVLFNYPAIEQYSHCPEDARSGFITNTLNKFFTTNGNMIWQKRLLWYFFVTKDRAGFADSMRKIQEWDFTRIIPCHGEVIETDSKRILSEAMGWFMERKHQR